MAKSELGTKRQCPKCGTRFYDLGKDNPITCISCGQEFIAEPILKPRRPVAEVAAPVAKAKPELKDDGDEDEDEDIDIEDDDDIEDIDDDDDIDSLLEIDDEDEDVDLDVDVDDDADESDK